MAANQFERHGKARAKLKALFANPSNVLVVHYSCESFYDLPDGRSPRITSIAVRNLDTAQTESFSIHQVAELSGISPASQEMEDRYNELERKMLESFYDCIKNNLTKWFLHWNMRDQNYGFQSIDHRYRVLGGIPIVVADDKKVDLSRLFIDLYGVSYIGHPRLENLLSINNIKAKDFMTGGQEAKAFEDKKYVDLHRSTLRKVDVFGNLAQRSYDKKLKTLSGWKEQHGMSLRTILYLAKKHWAYTLIIVLGALASALASIWKTIPYIEQIRAMF